MPTQDGKPTCHQLAGHRVSLPASHAGHEDRGVTMLPRLQRRHRDRDDPCRRRPPTIIHRSRGDNYLAPARTQSLPDLPTPAESTAFTLVIGVTPPEALQVRLVSSHRHRAYLRRSSTSPAHSLLHSGPRRGWRDRSLLSCQPWLPRGSRAGLPRCSQGPQGNDSVPGQAQRLDARCRTINSGTS